MQVGLFSALKTRKSLILHPGRIQKSRNTPQVHRYVTRSLAVLREAVRQWRAARPAGQPAPALPPYQQ